LLRPATTPRPPLSRLSLRALPPSWGQLFRRDRLLLGAFALVGLLIGYQLVVTLLRPSWSGPVTDWLRAALAWPEFLIVIGVSVWLTRVHRPGVLAWWLWSAALLSYTVARTLWTVDDQIIYHHHVPFPIFTDLFFMLQYPFLFLAVILLPRGQFWEHRLFMAVDGLLVMGAAIALSWSFILEPIYSASGISPLARFVSLTYPVGDLFVLCGLTITLLRPSRYPADRMVLAVLVAAVICLIVADSWVAWLLLSPPHVYTAGDPPDLFWLSFYLLVPLAGLVQLRFARNTQLQSGLSPVNVLNHRRIQRQDFLTSLRVFVPIVVALLAGAVLLMHATATTVQQGWKDQIPTFMMCFGLLLLVVVRQEMVFLENAQLRREQEVARANELALRELNRRKDEFLAVVTHELRTPVTSLQGYIELLARRVMRWHEGGAIAPDIFAMAHTLIAYCEDSLRRVARLVDDLLDQARIREGRLAFNVVPCDLGDIVWEAVKEQRLMAPERTISLQLPASPQVPIVADPLRIEQVVTNFLTNARKYSREDRPIAVRVEAAGEVARVSVRDEGVGVPPQEQMHVWERFHNIEGVRVQSGSGVSLGIGLSISKSIIEMHGGSVGVESEVGRGSTFWFTLPLANAVEEDAG
jgi:signal transduction histidine kinase